MLCVSRNNIIGGVSSVYGRNGAIIFTGIVEPGEMLLIDDAELWHDASPIRRMDDSRPGHRDILIITSPACRESEQKGRLPKQEMCGTRHL